MRTDGAHEFICTLATCPLKYGYVHYRPSIPGNAFMIAAFGILIFPALFLGVRYKTGLYTGVFVTGLVGEIIGYGARILMNNDPFNKDYFIMYLICLTLAPVFLSAAVYLNLGRIVVAYGEHISRIQPRTYTYIFSGFDFVALVIQAAGGAIAAIAVLKPKVWEGTHILVAGLAIQVASLVAFVALSLDFAWRVRSRKNQRNPRFANLYESRKFKIFLYSLGLTTLFILIRSCYRCAELSGGFSGYLAQDQTAFMVLDGVMILLASILLTAQNPGQVFGEAWPETKYAWGKSKRDNTVVMEATGVDTSVPLEREKSAQQ